MIQTSTAFIVGAGANVPYGLPTGRDLRDVIISQKTNSSYFTALNIPGYDTKRFTEFCDVFRMSNIQSIDKFLGFHPEYLLEGKLAIAFSLKQHEIQGQKNIHKDDWMFFLYNRMIEGIDSSDQAYLINNNKVHFCTFNYDRLLDYSLALSFFNSFRANPRVQKGFGRGTWDDVLNGFTFKIDHVYGRIGDLTVNRIDDDDVAKVGDYFDKIQLINERRKTVSNIVDDLEKCDRVFFLGYGFAQENNELLQLSRVCQNKKTYATAYHWHPEETSRVWTEQNIKCTFVDCTPMDLLRRFL